MFESLASLRQALADVVSHKPRVAGALLLLVAAIFARLNLDLTKPRHHLSVQLGLVTGACLGLGVWIIITGRTAARGGLKAPRWWSLGSGVFMCAGMGLGVYVVHNFVP
jgi:hypothetical protein